MAWIAVVPPSPRHPHERYQVCYREGTRQRSAGVFPTKRRAEAERRAIERGRTELTGATRHQPSTTWPSGTRSRVDRTMSNAWSSSCSNRARSAPGKAARTNSTRPDSSGPIADSAPLTPWFLASRPVFRSGVGQSLLQRACMPSSLPLGKASIERLVLKADGRVAESDSAGIEPTTARTRSLARSSHGQADAAPGTLLKRFLDERRARRGRHPFWRCAAVAGWRDVVRCGMPLEAATVRPI